MIKWHLNCDSGNTCNKCHSILDCTASTVVRVRNDGYQGHVLPVKGELSCFIFSGLVQVAGLAY